MQLTVTNTSGADLAAGALPGPLSQFAIAAAGNVVTGVSEADLRAGEDKGDPVYKRINALIQQGVINVAAANPGTGDTLTGLIDVMEEATTVA